MKSRMTCNRLITIPPTRLLSPPTSPSLSFLCSTRLSIAPSLQLALPRHSRRHGSTITSTPPLTKRAQHARIPRLASLATSTTITTTATALLRAGDNNRHHLPATPNTHPPLLRTPTHSQRSSRSRSPRQRHSIGITGSAPQPARLRPQRGRQPAMARGPLQAAGQ